MAQIFPLLDMPEVVLVDLIEKIGVKSLQSLRKVSRNIRQFIDDVKPDPCLSSIIITVKRRNILVECESSGATYKIDYQKHYDGCLVVHGESQKEMMDHDYATTFFKDFELVLKDQKAILPVFHVYMKSKLGRLILPESYTQFYAGFKKVMESRKRPLQVKQFFIDALEQEHVMSILPFLDSEILKEIRIFDAEGLHSLRKTMEVNEIVELEQWKKVETMEIGQFIVDIPIENFMHFSYATVGLLRITSDDMDVLKESCIKSPKFKFLLIKYEEFVDEDRFLRIRGKPSNDGDHNVRRDWNYSIPKSGKTLHLQQRPRIGIIKLMRF